MPQYETFSDLGEPSGMPPPTPQPPGKAIIEVKCTKCSAAQTVQANLGAKQPLEKGAIAFPKDCMLKCQTCGNTLNLTGLKLQLETQARQPVVLD